MAEDNAHLGAHDGDGEAPPEVSAGIACAPLLADARSWIRRRVETIDMLAHEETHRRVSIDFALSPDQYRALAIDDGVVVPISVLTKERRRNFSLRDEGGRAIPVLGKEQNGVKGANTGVATFRGPGCEDRRLWPSRFSTWRSGRCWERSSEVAVGWTSRTSSCSSFVTSSRSCAAR
jgi:hypothetical protein